MSGSLQTDYDSVLYPSALYPQTHPDRLATNATLFGVAPAKISRAHVLELGCGDGTNLIAMADGLPESRFLGIDLAGAPVRKGNELICALGLSNIQLRQLDVLETPADIGTFDFIIAHGLYSWVPEVVRKKILRLCEEHLSANGIAYFSYNAYPGCHLRDLVRHMMRFHAAQFTEPKEKIKQARALVKFASEARAKSGLWQSILSQQLDRIGRYTDSGFFHDDLGEINQPFYFFEFMEAADRHGLQFLSEADLPDMLADGFTDSAVAMLQQLESRDVIAREQYLDFLKGKAFRQTLLCRKGLVLERTLSPEKVFLLFVGGEVRPANTQLDIRKVQPEDFHGPKGSVIATGNPVVKAALIHLGKLFPAYLPFADLLVLAREQCGRADEMAGQSFEQDRKDLAEFVVRAHAMAFLELHTIPPPFSAQISEKPRASRLARTQLEQGDVIATMRHVTYRVEGVLARTLLRSLDGTRDRPVLLEQLGEVIRNGTAALEKDGKKIGDPLAALGELPAQLETQLQGLARAGLLAG